MQIEAGSPENYIEKIPEERKEAFSRLRHVILANLPGGFEEIMNYGMIGYVVPLSRFPEGYNSDSGQPLPFINIGSQKNYIALYHNGIYADEALRQWFTGEFLKETGKKPDMGKSCIRFRKPEEIPFRLIGRLSKKISLDKWIEMYETAKRKHWH